MTLETWLSCNEWLNETAESLRQQYASTPYRVRLLFDCDIVHDGWLVEALAATGPTSMYNISQWVIDLVGTIHIPTIQIFPSKAPGVWRIHHNSSEWYHHF